MWLELDGITRRFGRRLALDDLRLSLARGEIACLLGPSGSGKSTTLRCIAGFEVPDAGRITCDGRVYSGGGTHVPTEQRGVGFVFQDLALFPHLSVRDNVGFGLHSLPRRERAARVEELLDLVDLADRADSWPAQLSGGQQQRVAIARALAPRPALLLLDEPFSSLDPSLREQLAPEVRRLLKSQGITALAVSHDRHDAFALADRVAVLRHGRVEQYGTPEELYHAPASRFVAGFVGHASFLAASRLDAGSWATELGPVQVPGQPGPDCRTGAHEIMLRPEQVRIVADSPIRARIVERRFRGADVLHLVELPGGRQLYALGPGDERHAVGNTVALRLEASAARLFTAGSDTR